MPFKMASLGPAGQSEAGVGERYSYLHDSFFVLLSNTKAKQYRMSESAATDCYVAFDFDPPITASRYSFQNTSAFKIPDS